MVPAMPDVSAPVSPDEPSPVDAPVAVYDVLGTRVGATSEGPAGAPAILLIQVALLTDVSKLSPINVAADACNVVSLHSGLFQSAKGSF